MLDDFLVRAALAGTGTALAASLLGCFVIWQRMAFFGDATAHAAILGVALALGFSMSVFAGVTLVALAMALLVFALTARGQSTDALLGVLAHSALAAGLVAVTLLPGQRVNLDAYLFGDVLTVSVGDLWVIWGGVTVVAGTLWWHWQGLLTATVSPDLAYAAGIDPRRQQLILTMLLALVVAVAIKVVGALLITALLIIPAAAARRIAATPEAMAAAAAAIGVAAALGGMGAALRFDTPVGPTIVCLAAVIFAVLTIGGKLRNLGG